MMGFWKRTAGICLALLLGSSRVFGADTLAWDVGRDTVSAEVQTWTVPDVLQQVASATGWQIFLDPEITNRIPAKFSGKQPGDALRNLLSGYNYALVPEVKGPSKLFVFRTSREQATRAIQPVEKAAKKKSSRIPNELVVTLKPGEKIEDLAKRLGAKIVGRSDGQNTYRLRFEDEKATESARTSLQDDSSVDGVDSNYTVWRPDTAQALGTPGGPINLTPKASPDGKYTVVGLIDTAVQPKEGNLSAFLHPNTAEGDVLEGGDLTHGTSMAAAILRSLSATSDEKSTTVRILPVNVFNAESEQTTTFDIANGIYKAVNGGAMIVNLSLGGEGDSSFLHKTIKSAHDQDVLFIGAAGNNGGTAPTYPAAYSEVIAVTALDRNGKLAPYATHGSWVDQAAPGGVIVTFNGQQYYVVGTSTATALVSGKIAGDTAAGKTPAK
jgi:thermitase